MLYNFLMENNHPHRSRQHQFHKFSLAAGWEGIESRVVGETPIGLSVNGEPWVTFMCTHSQLEALGVGFLFNEGIIQSNNDIALAGVCPSGGNIDIWLHKSISKPSSWRRTSGCTGGLTSSGDGGGDSPSSSLIDFSIAPEKLITALEQLFAAQELYREARGVHCSAISDGERFIFQAEDIGRHNTLDKLAGLLLMHPQPAGPRIILTTGRISSEMLQKSVRMGAAMVVSRTSPTSLSIRSAERLGITLVGYARRNQFHVYTHPTRFTAFGKAKPIRSDRQITMQGQGHNFAHPAD